MQISFEIFNECFNIRLLRNIILGYMRIEVAVGAFFDAPRNVNIK
jgi:hypothetical protein